MIDATRIFGGVTQAMIDADCELATRLQKEEREELTIEEKSRLFMELIDKRKKHFTRLRAEKIRIKPSTKAQKRNQMCTCLKNIANYKDNQLKNKSFEEIQMLFNNTMKWIEAFVPMDTKLVKGSEKAEKVVRKQQKENMVYYLLVEKMYPFSRNFLLQMCNNVRLQVNYELHMAYDLLRLIKRQINE
nr:hypothetical protein [Tanacetum cinerariifolium]